MNTASKPTRVIHLPNVPDRERSLEGWIQELSAFRADLGERFHLTITDFSSGDEGQLRTRIEAFLEMIQTRRAEP